MSIALFDSSGRPEVSVSISNSGGTLLVFLPGNNEPPSSNATRDTRNNRPVLDFDDGSGEEAVFSGIMPNQYQGGGVDVRIHYMMTSATSGNTDWDVSWERCNAGGHDLDADSFGAVNSTNDTTVPSTAGAVDVVSVTFTDGADMDSVAAGELFRVKVTRDGSSDTASGDAELLAVEIREQ